MANRIRVSRDDWGACHFNPPVLGPGGEFCFPAVHMDESCGRFEKVEGKKA